MSKTIGWLALVVACLVPGACRSPASYHKQADAVATKILAAKQREATGRTAPFTIEPPLDTLRRKLLLAQALPHSSAASLGTDQLPTVPHWPEPRTVVPAKAPADAAKLGTRDKPLILSLAQALAIGARNNRDYQTWKEAVFASALRLDLERNEFRTTFYGFFSALAEVDRAGGDTAAGGVTSFDARLQRKLKSGATMTTGIALDLARLVASDQASSVGVLADASITVPLLSGSGRHIVAEPLTLAEREVLYALYDFERSRRTYAVRVAAEYLDVLQQHDRIVNAEANYKGLVAAGRRAHRLVDSGRIPGIDADEAMQDELRARDRWIAARELYRTRLDRFKITLGLPTDAHVDLDHAELKRLTADTRNRLDLDAAAAPKEERVPPADVPIKLVEPTREGAGPFELDEAAAIRTALDRRLDLRVANLMVEDAQRAVVFEADGLRARLDLVGAAQAGDRRSTVGSATRANARLRPDHGLYSLGLDLDLPWEKTDERNRYRNSLIALEQAARAVQKLEDEIKLDVRDALRALAQARESARIQAQGVVLATRRVKNTDLLLQAGRAKVRDVLFAQESLLSAQNALTAALRNYRVAELELQRDLGVLAITDTGLWREYRPDEHK